MFHPMNFLTWLGKKLDEGWFSRLMMVGIGYFAWDVLSWSEAFASTALATKSDLMGTAAVLAATSAAPLGLLTLALNKYLEMRAAQPRIIDRRKDG